MSEELNFPLIQLSVFLKTLFPLDVSQNIKYLCSLSLAIAFNLNLAVSLNYSKNQHKNHNLIYLLHIQIYSYLRSQ